MMLLFVMLLQVLAILGGDLAIGQSRIAWIGLILLSSS